MIRFIALLLISEFISIFALTPSVPVQFRDTADHAFSKGWKNHERAKIVEIFDIHTHYQRTATTIEQIKTIANFWIPELKEMDVTGCAVMGGPDSLLSFINSQQDKNQYLYPFMWITYDNPDTSKLNQLASSHLIKGVKLHNNEIYKAGADYKIRSTPIWDSVYEICARNNLPILWHLNQRYRPDRSGGETGAFWSKLPYSNKDVLTHFIKIAKAHPKTIFILAHFDFLGYKQLGTLFESLPNVYSEGSSSWEIGIDENILTEYQQEAKSFAIKHADRILFGTDFIFDTRSKSNDPIWRRNAYQSYIRFLIQLDLPQDVLDKITYKNAKQLLSIK